MAPRPTKPASYDFGVPIIAEPLPPLDDIPDIPDEDILSGAPPIALDGSVNPELWAPSEVEAEIMPPLIPAKATSRAQGRRSSQAEVEKALVSLYMSHRNAKRPSTLGPTPFPTILEDVEWPNTAALAMARTPKSKRRAGGRGRPKTRRGDENIVYVISIIFMHSSANDVFSMFGTLSREERATPKHGRVRVTSFATLPGSPLH